MITSKQRIYLEMAEESRKSRVNEKGEIRHGNCNVLTDLANIKAEVDAENDLSNSVINFYSDIGAFFNKYCNEQSQLTA